MDEITNLQQKLEDLSKMYSDIRSSVLSVSAKAKAGKFTKEEMCDIGFLCRESVSRSEEIRKDIGAVKALVDRLVCVKSLADFLANPMKSQTVHGQLCSGTPVFKKNCALPKKDSKEYIEMMEYFGITQEGIEKGVAKISWQKICNHVTELVELGKSIPEFIPKVYDDYTVTHRRK